eukprot:454807_1
MSEVHFVNQELAANYQCAVCLETVHSPVIITTCSKHIFCRNCIQRLIDEDDRKNNTVHKCPTCRQTFHSNQVQQVVFIQFQIDKLQVYCNNHQNVEWCPWTGNYTDLETHMENCSYNVVECDLCGESCTTMSLIQHKIQHQKSIESKAEEKISCQYCNAKLKRKHMRGHQKQNHMHRWKSDRLHAMRQKFAKLESSQCDLMQKIIANRSTFDK